MIFSKLNGGDDLSAYPAAIQRALAYLRDTDIMSLELGRHELEGDDMFVNVMDMTTHPMEGSHPEVHKKYIDLMYWPEGASASGWPLSGHPSRCLRPGRRTTSPCWRMWPTECMLVANPRLLRHLLPLGCPPARPHAGRRAGHQPARRW